MSEASRLRTVKFTPPEKFSGGYSSDVVDWVFQLELFFAART
jgi:hypothetical protein